MAFKGSTAHAQTQSGKRMQVARQSQRRMEYKKLYPSSGSKEYRNVVVSTATQRVR